MAIPKNTRITVSVDELLSLINAVENAQKEALDELRCCNPATVRDFEYLESAPARFAALLRKLDEAYDRATGSLAKKVPFTGPKEEEVILADPMGGYHSMSREVPEDENGPSPQE